MTQIFKNQPQRVAIGAFTSPQGASVQVYISQPWFKAFEALSKVDIDSGKTSGVSFDPLPPYQFGEIVFSSGAAALKRIPSVGLGNVLYDGGLNAAPFWGPLPDAPAAVGDDASLTLAQRSFATRQASSSSASSATTDILATQIFGA